ncbi:trypsin-like serine peptidase [Actinomadura sp. ATCC 39365]|uniref:trypsin-like serine peptidase n=1 Tax=Nonomuraea sp. NPDC005692 TaxID=3157168 RepID=UPI0033EA551C
MKRILLPAGGALLATGLLAAGLAGAAQADPDVDAAALAASEQKAAEVLDFWTKSDNAALKGATAYYWDNKDVKKIVQKGGYVADGKPGQSEPIGAEKTTTVKSQNVNLPKSIGKVFFEGRDGKLYWCSGTSIQSQYRNLVATAGHCVYDIAANDEVVSRWVFVPGYYQGKAPWGIYVGKQAFTHYDFSNYEDFDRDYAFVTVYNGVGGVLNKAKQVTKAEFDAYKGEKEPKVTQVTREEYVKGKLDPKTTEYYSVDPGSRAEKVGPDFPGAVVEKVEVSKSTWWRAPVGKANGAKYGEPETSQVTKHEYLSYRGPGEKNVDSAGNYTITRYYTQQWYKPGTEFKFLRTDFFIYVHEIKDVGRLGDNVGGQGFAWNQPTGKYVRTFGYPFAKHPDGSKPYSGVTPKWCYGKTGAKATKVPSLKIEEHISLKCAVTGGYNGAPWLLKYSNAKRMGYVNGVTSVLYDTDGNDRWDYMSSPYFDGETNAVYSSAAKVWSGSLIPKADS